MVTWIFRPQYDEFHTPAMDGRPKFACSHTPDTGISDFIWKVSVETFIIIKTGQFFYASKAFLIILPPPIQS